MLEKKRPGINKHLIIKFLIYLEIKSSWLSQHLLRTLVLMKENLNNQLPLFFSPLPTYMLSLQYSTGQYVKEKWNKLILWK